MGRIHGSVIGKLSGTVGDVSFRQRNGKTVVCTKTKSFVPGTDPASVERRDRFGNLVKVSRTLYSIPELKRLWQLAAGKNKSAFNLAMKSNLNVAGPASIPKFVALTPPGGFLVEPLNITFSGKSVAAEIPAAAVDTGSDPSVRTEARLVVMFCLSGPTDLSLDKFNVMACISSPVPLIHDAPVSFVIDLPALDARMVARYQNKKSFSALIISDEQENPVRHSNTFQCIWSQEPSP
ncbi:MAG: hypothetical protein ACLP05_11180 [Candidatus Kryptoniota bacterium]